MYKDSVVAKKQFGQNFLKDESVLHKIIQAMPKNDNKIVEIGPGLGDLTKFLVDIKSVEAFEVDTDLCKILQRTFKKEIATKQLHINCGDVLEAWESMLIDVDAPSSANNFLSSSIVSSCSKNIIPESSKVS